MENTKTTKELLLRTIAMKTSDTLDRKEVEKISNGYDDGKPSIYQAWWDDKPHQILRRVLEGKLHD